MLSEFFRQRTFLWNDTSDDGLIFAAATELGPFIVSSLRFIEG